MDWRLVAYWGLGVTTRSHFALSLGGEPFKQQLRGFCLGGAL